MLKIGFWSRLDRGSEGCREGLWRLAADEFKREKVNFTILVGIVDKDLLRRLNEAKAQIKGKAAKEKAEQDFIQAEAEYLKRNIPVIPGVKTYVVTSPAYDGWLGEEIARKLVERRDILLYRPGGDRLEIKQISKFLGVYAPKQGTWLRGDYFDTPVLRVLKDEIKRGTRGIGDINAVGGFAVSVFHPGDSTEIKKPFFSLPGCSKTAATRTAENQSGICILKAASGNLKEASLITYNFKDLVSDEWSLVQPPPGSTRIQCALIDQMKVKGPLSIGQFEDFTSIPRDQVKKELDGLMERKSSKSWSGLFEDPRSHRYYFKADWFETKLDYPKFKGEYALDAILAFGCLHASCKHTDMQFFCNELAKIILANGITVFAGSGDFIEGLKHDLMIQGEVYGGRHYVFNYTKQEKLAAYLVSQVIRKVFRERITPRLKSKNIKGISQDELANLVREALLTFLYIPGNHCSWTSPLGFDPLSIFGVQLRNFVSEDIAQTLAEYNLFLRDVGKILDEKIVERAQNQPYKLPSGLTVSMLHPYMSRTKTPSIRPQEMMGKSSSQIVIGANFHTAEVVQQWEFELGQRVCLQVGTIKRRSGFEDTKLKTVDFGVGLLKVWSQNQRIKKTEAAFYGTPTPDLIAGNEAVLEDFEKRLNLG